MRTASSRRHAQRNDMLQGAIETKSTASEFSFRIANNAIRDAHFEISKPIISIAHTRGSSSVANQEHALESLGSQQDLDRRRIDMMPISNQLGRHGRVRSVRRR